LDVTAAATDLSASAAGWLGRPDSRLSLLRGFDLHLHGERVPVPETSQRVVAFLALRDRAVTRIQVAGTLWPETSDERAAASLRTALWRVRLLGAPLVHVDGSRLSLAPGVGVDVWAMVASAGRLLDRTRAPSEEELNGFVWDSTRWGELLPEWFDDWIMMERERLRQVRLHALEALCEVLSTQGHHSQAVQIGMAAVAEEPLRESAQRALISAHLTEGNVSEAIRQFQAYRRLLQEELGVAPSAALEQLVPPVRIG
jgi:DNA-binding SARP family transcriptional activator